MRRGVLVAAMVVLSGCAAHSNVGLNSGGNALSQSSVSVNANVQSSSTAQALLALGIAVLVFAGGQEGDAPAPRLLPERKINEQDCTQPIADLSANLRCR